MKVNGEAIYGTSRHAVRRRNSATFSDTEKDEKGKPMFIPAWDWRCTTKPGKIYLLIFNWPANGKFELPGLQSKVTKAYVLAGHQEVECATRPMPA